MATENWSVMTKTADVVQPNSLADSGTTNAGTTYDNGSGLHRFAICEGVFAWGSSPTAGTPVDVYMVPAPDGTNFSDGSSSVVPSGAMFVGSFFVQTGTSQRLVTRRFELLPCKVAFIVVNRTGQAMSSSGNHVHLHTFDRTIN